MASITDDLTTLAELSPLETMLIRDLGTYYLIALSIGQSLWDSYRLIYSPNSSTKLQPWLPLHGTPYWHWKRRSVSFRCWNVEKLCLMPFQKEEVCLEVSCEDINFLMSQHNPCIIRSSWRSIKYLYLTFRYLAILVQGWEIFLLVYE